MRRTIDPRIPCGLLLAAMAWAAWVAGQRAYADAAYSAGLGITEFPAEDAPGRLEAYDEACRRAPSTFLYQLRSGQIHLARVGGEGAAEHLERAGERLRRAVAVHPLDARARISLAQWHAVSGDRGSALTEARRALFLGPRHPFAQSGAVTIGADLWAATGDLDALALALDAGALRLSWDASAVPRKGGAPAPVRVAFGRRRDALLGDLLEAAGTNPERLKIAIRWTERDRPVVADVLSGRLRRAAGKDGT